MNRVSFSCLVLMLFLLLLSFHECSYVSFKALLEMVSNHIKEIVVYGRSHYGPRHMD